MREDRGKSCALFLAKLYVLQIEIPDRIFFLMEVECRNYFPLKKIKKSLVDGVLFSFATQNFCDNAIYDLTFLKRTSHARRICAKFDQILLLSCRILHFTMK